MPSFYIDTSALLKRYNEEAGTEFINTLYEYIEKNNQYLFTSELTDVEFASAVFRLTREQKLTRDTAIGIIYNFEIESDIRLTNIPFHDGIIYQAKSILSSHHLKSHDAIQLASAMEARKYHDDLFFVADDEKLCKAAEQEGLPVLRPREQESINTLSTITGMT